MSGHERYMTNRLNSKFKLNHFNRSGMERQKLKQPNSNVFFDKKPANYLKNSVT